MRAIVRKQYGGPEQLQIEEVPTPKPGPGQVLVRVRAFGLNRAEQYFRQGLWGEVAAISGIECVGEVAEDGDGLLPAGQQVLALMGGMGRSIAGSYAEYTCVPCSNVMPVTSRLGWAELAALPESYATAYACLQDNLALIEGQTLVIRGAGSALGQAALNIAVQAGAHVIATLRRPDKQDKLHALGAEQVLQEQPELNLRLRAEYPAGVDAVLDLVGTSTLLDSLRMAGRRGRVCLAGFLGGGAPLAELDPLRHLPSGVQLSFFASAFVFGNEQYPLAEIPFQAIIERAERGDYQAKPAHIFPFEEIRAAHRLLDEEGADGKIVMVV
jgi:NADPH:quinone reductase-like Zn-dependent oxidoreductase